MKEIKRLRILQQAEEGEITGSAAADQLGLSLRQVRRLITRYREKGAAGLVHGNRGRPAYNRVAEDVRLKIQELLENEYKDYGDSHFIEVLSKKYGLSISLSTLHRIRQALGQKSPRERRTPFYRSRRGRKPQAGMLLQGDSNRYDWLEGRGNCLTLIAYIDDATNEIPGAIFRDEEDVSGYFLGLQEICLTQGLPQAIRINQRTIFQRPARPTLDQELPGQLPKSQYGRLLEELGIELIIAKSSQPKEQVKWIWAMLQDCLVNALRKANACTLIEANQVLRDYLPKFNARFRVNAPEGGTAYIPWPSEYRSETFFCFKHTHTVTNDNTILFESQWLHIPPSPQRRSYAKALVEIWQHLDGQLEVLYQGQSLAIFKIADCQPIRIEKFLTTSEQETTEKGPRENITPKRSGGSKPY